MNVTNNARLTKAECIYSDEPIRTTEDAIRLLADEIKDIEQEQIIVINLDPKDYPLDYSVVSVGDMSSSITTVRNVFKCALASNASRIILLHNRPFGAASPSRADMDVTRRIVNTGALMEIYLCDHIIIGADANDIYSFAKAEPFTFIV
jgi:DNA repair protein RadC